MVLSSLVLRFIMTKLLLGEKKPSVGMLRDWASHLHSLLHLRRGGPVILPGSSFWSLKLFSIVFTAGHDVERGPSHGLGHVLQVEVF